MPFTQSSLDFLAENRLMDSRSFFQEHRESYDTLVLNPMKELVVSLTPVMKQIDEQLICEPKVGRSISRIYRDTRFSHDKSIYRDVMWCVFMRSKQLYEGPPAFFVEVSPIGYRYGCGYYQAASASMTAIRDMIIQDDRAYLEARASFDLQKTFSLLDERYKRTKYKDQTEKKREWLDQKNICAAVSGNDFQLLYSPCFSEKIAQDFLKIGAFYHFLITAESRRPHGIPDEGFAPDPFCGH